MTSELTKLIAEIEGDVDHKRWLTVSEKDIRTFIRTIREEDADNYRLRKLLFRATEGGTIGYECEHWFPLESTCSLCDAAWKAAK